MKELRSGLKGQNTKERKIKSHFWALHSLSKFGGFTYQL